MNLFYEWSAFFLNWIASSVFIIQGIKMEPIQVAEHAGK